MVDDSDDIDDLMDDFEEMRESAEGLDGNGPSSPSELFSPEFMAQYTGHESFEEFIDESPWTVESEEDFEEIPEEDFDEYVAENTAFGSEEEMTQAATKHWAAREIGL